MIKSQYSSQLGKLLSLLTSRCWTFLSNGANKLSSSIEIQAGAMELLGNGVSLRMLQTLSLQILELEIS